MDIFVSYASADRARAARLADTLTQAGYTVWWDRTIPPGRVFDEVIQEAIDAARCMIVLWSRESVRSNWVKTEAAEGAARGMLLPALLDDAELPIEFRRIQAARLVDWNGDTDDAQYRQLLGAVVQLLAGGAAPSVPAPLDTHRAANDRSGLIKTLGIAALGALVSLVAVWLWLRSAAAPPPRAPPQQAAAPAAAAAAPTPAPTSTTANGRVDLLAAENGGQLVVASSEAWQKMIDGDVDTYGWADKGYGVFAFKDSRAATFDTLGVYISSADGTNLREFEIFASDESPNGPFRSLGRYTTRNERVIRDPFQAFTFAPVTARYFKLQALSNFANGEATIVYEI